MGEKSLKPSPSPNDAFRFESDPSFRTETDFHSIAVALVMWEAGGGNGGPGVLYSRVVGR